MLRLNVCLHLVRGITKERTSHRNLLWHYKRVGFICSFTLWPKYLWLDWGSLLPMNQQIVSQQSKPKRRRKQPKATQRWYTILSMNWNANKTKKKKKKLFKRSKRISVFLMKLMSTYCIKQLVQSVRIWCWQEILLPSLLSCICWMTAW